MPPREPPPFGRRGAPRTAAVRPRVSARSFAPPPSPSPSPSSPADAPPPPERDPVEVVRAREDDETLMARFIGHDWPDYRDLWWLMQFDGALIPSFSVTALSFSFAWLFYRRLYGAGFAAMAAQIALTHYSLLASTVGGLLLSVLIGVFGKALVVRKGMATIKMLRGEDLRLVGMMGGTRLAPAIFAFFFVFAVTLAEFPGSLTQLRSSETFFIPGELADALKSF